MTTPKLLKIITDGELLGRLINSEASRRLSAWDELWEIYGAPIRQTTEHLVTFFPHLNSDVIYDEFRDWCRSEEVLEAAARQCGSFRLFIHRTLREFVRYQSAKANEFIEERDAQRINSSDVDSILKTLEMDIRFAKEIVKRSRFAVRETFEDKKAFDLVFPHCLNEAAMPTEEVDEIAAQTEMSRSSVTTMKNRIRNRMSKKIESEIRASCGSWIDTKKEYNYLKKVLREGLSVPNAVLKSDRTQRDE